ncbi:hypothetical protein ACFQ12_06455, partial [Methylobacterium trifolii]
GRARAIADRDREAAAPGRQPALAPEQAPIGLGLARIEAGQVEDLSGCGFGELAPTRVAVVRDGGTVRFSRGGGGDFSPYTTGRDTDEEKFAALQAAGGWARNSAMAATKRSP